MLVARRYLVSGRVQGVGFRYFAREAAAREAVAGWAANLSDGRVEILAEGEEGAVGRFEGQIRTGPPAAVVSDVSVFVLPPTGNQSGFFVR